MTYATIAVCIKKLKSCSVQSIWYAKSSLEGSKFIEWNHSTKNVWTMIIFLQWRHISIILYGNYQFYNLWTLPVFSLVENTAKDFSRFFVIIFFWKKFQVSYKEIFFCHIGLSIYFGRSIFVKYRSELICVSSFQIPSCLKTKKNIPWKI